MPVAPAVAFEFDIVFSNRGKSSFVPTTCASVEDVENTSGKSGRIPLNWVMMAGVQLGPFKSSAISRT